MGSLYVVCVVNTQLNQLLDKGLYHPFHSKCWSHAKPKELALVFIEHFLCAHWMQEVMRNAKETMLHSDRLLFPYL